MRITQNKVEEIILTILGEEGSSLVSELYGKEDVSEFDLATRTDKDIKVIRRMLYQLYNNNLVGFTRKKDKQKGWYVYYWTLLPDSIKFMYFKRKRELLFKLKKRLGEENKELFFVCPNKCVRLNFDRAMDFEFHCPECGELVNQDDNKDRINSIKTRILEIEAEIEIETKEMKKEKAKLRKKMLIAKEKEAKREAKIKAAEKKAKDKEEAEKKAKKEAAKKKVVARKKSSKVLKEAKKKEIKKKAVKNKLTETKEVKTKKKAAKKKLVKKKVDKKKEIKKKAVKKKAAKKKIIKSIKSSVTKKKVTKKK